MLRPPRTYNLLPPRAAGARDRSPGGSFSALASASKLVFRPARTKLVARAKVRPEQRVSRMKRLRLRSLSRVRLLAPLVCLALTPVVVRADLHSDIEAVLADKLLHKAAVGVEVVRLGDGAGKDGAAKDE